MKIAFSGVFDIANYGDHLFPLVFEQQMRKNAVECELYLFSCTAGNQALGVNTPIYALRDLEAMHIKHHFDAIIVAGGWIAHFTLLKQKMRAEDEEYKDYPIYESWIIPSLVALRHNIKLIWNAPDTYYENSSFYQNFLYGLCSNVDYLSVRSKFSVEALATAGIERSHIFLVPDTALMLSKVFSKDELLSIRKRILPGQEPYICYHATRYLPESELGNIVPMLNQLTEQGYKVVLLPLAYTHDDQSILRKIYKAGEQRYFCFDRELVLKEQVAILAGCSLYVGESFHGAVTAFSYNIPAVVFNHLEQKKQDELFSMFNAGQFLVSKGEELPTAVQTALQQHSLILGLIDQKQQIIEKHFTNIASILQEEPNEKFAQKFIDGFVDAIASLNRFGSERDLAWYKNNKENQDMWIKSQQARIAELEGGIQWHLERTEQMNAQFALQQGRIVELEGGIQWHLEQTEQMNAQLALQQSRIAELEGGIQWHLEQTEQINAQLALQQGRIAELEGGIQWHLEQTEQMNAQLALQQGRIVELEGGIQWHLEQTEQMNVQYFNQQTRIAELEKCVSTHKDYQVVLEQKIISLQQLNEEQLLQIRIAWNELEDIKNSFLWKITHLIK